MRVKQERAPPYVQEGPRRERGSSGLVGARPLRGRRGEPALLTTLRRRRTHSSAANTAPNNRHPLGRSERPAFRKLRLLQDIFSTAP